MIKNAYFTALLIHGVHVNTVWLPSAIPPLGVLLCVTYHTNYTVHFVCTVHVLHSVLYRGICVHVFATLRVLLLQQASCAGGVNAGRIISRMGEWERDFTSR